MITTEITKRSIKVFNYDLTDKKTTHIKSLPLILENVFEEIPETIMLSLEKPKRLSLSDIAKISEYVSEPLNKNYLEFLKKHEPYVYELTIDNKIVGTRIVKERDFKKRFELVFENKYLKIKCPEHLHTYSSNKLETAKLNY